MRNETQLRLMQSRDDEQRKDVTRTARDYRKQYPELTWGEAIALAEKHVAGRGPLVVN